MVLFWNAQRPCPGEVRDEVVGPAAIQVADRQARSPRCAFRVRHVLLFIQAHSP